ncbi:BnaC01g35620D [Brassica napus]|uniref:BnaC01g35620D protein n=1 Tax=Brassica napus TaxID=3708 RepID=A0A078G922_BRANA|nr:BnaC01g35620D [Brassica napus]
MLLRNPINPKASIFKLLFNDYSHFIAIPESCKTTTQFKQLHSQIIIQGLEPNPTIQKKLLLSWSSRLNGDIGYAYKLFVKMPEPDVVVWNNMIKGFSRVGCVKEGVRLYLNMLKKGVTPDGHTFPFLLSGLKPDCGKKLHCHVVKFGLGSNLYVQNGLVQMYSLCGLMDMAHLARMYFDDMQVRDRISWTIMIDGYLRADCFNESLDLFRAMQNAGMIPDEFTMVSVLTACAHLGALEIGEWVKTYIDKNKIKNDVVVGNALIDMYFKCGCCEKAQKVFHEMRQRDKFTWTAMVVGLANNGQGEDAIKVFFQMQDMSIQPDEITYLGVLSACNHSGMIEQAKDFFSKMRSDHRIEPSLAHYGCMVDLLGRAGLVKEAYEMIRNMPVNPNSIVWGALLSASRLHNDESMAELAAKKILELEPDNGAVYALLCNIYAACERWEDLREVRKEMVDVAAKKIPGCSLIDVNGVTYEFVCRDKSHLQSEEIYRKLEELAQESTFARHLPSELLFEAG